MPDNRLKPQMGYSLMTYLVHCDRGQVLEFLPKGLKIAEVGVLAGDYSNFLLKRAQPASLTLIDSWQHHDDPNYARDGANSENAIQETRYHQVRNRFYDQIAEGTITIIRDLSVNALSQIPPNSMDFVYIDAMHYEDAVLADLHAAAEAVSDDGILAGHDFCNHVQARRSNFGVIAAVKAFCAATGYKLIMITQETWPSYYLAKPGAELARTFMQGIFTSPHEMVGFDDALIDRVRQKVIPLADGEKTVTWVS